jgi:hypothetical protein
MEVNEGLHTVRMIYFTVRYESQNGSNDPSLLCNRTVMLAVTYASIYFSYDVPAMHVS